MKRAAVLSLGLAIIGACVAYDVHRIWARDVRDDNARRGTSFSLTNLPFGGDAEGVRRDAILGVVAAGAIVTSLLVLISKRT
jgi:hypothetical protein